MISNKNPVKIQMTSFFIVGRIAVFAYREEIYGLVHERRNSNINELI